MAEKITDLNPQKKIVPALALDWDGTIRRSKSEPEGFIAGPSDIELMPGIEEAIWNYRRKGFIVIGVSNQGGVACGYKLPAEIEYEMKVTLDLFETNPFHIVKMCYHYEKGTVRPFNMRSLLRKPDYGMLAIAEAQAWDHGFVIDWNNSLFVGDRTEDLECANNARIKFMHINDFLKPHSIEIKIGD
jgi:D-glycero-D-manno-heptose 1,7-bisphosphate phosphatase